MLFAALIASINVLPSADYERDCNQLKYRNTHAQLSCDSGDNNSSSYSYKNFPGSNLIHLVGAWFSAYDAT